MVTVFVFVNTPVERVWGNLNSYFTYLDIEENSDKNFDLIFYIEGNHKINTSEIQNRAFLRAE